MIQIFIPTRGTATSSPLLITTPAACIGSATSAWAITPARALAWAVWGTTGNMTDDGPPVGPTMPKDAILMDVILSDTGYIDTHADNPRDPDTHRDNNVGYSDGHVETHKHTHSRRVCGATIIAGMNTTSARRHRNSTCGNVAANPNSQNRKGT